MTKTKTKTKTTKSTPQVQELRTLRPRGSGTGGGGGGGGGGRERRAGGKIQCTGCGDEEVNPTGPGVAFMRIRRQRVVVLCADCTAKSMAAVGLKIEPEPVVTPSTPPTSGGEQQVITAADVGTLTP